MHVLKQLGVVSLLVLALASSVSARVIRLETAVALTDHSEPAIQRAFQRALETSVRGVIAMGLSSMWVDDASVLGDVVIIRLIATDEEDEGDEDDEEDDWGPGPEMGRQTF